MPCDYSQYPADWPAISQRILFRARHRCEWPGCGAPNGWWAYWISAEKRVFRKPTWKPQPGVRVTRIVLTVAHKDHDISNNADENLAAWCQYHHLVYDRELHARHAAETRRRRREGAAWAQPCLFGGEEWEERTVKSRSVTLSEKA